MLSSIPCESIESFKFFCKYIEILLFEYNIWRLICAHVWSTFKRNFFLHTAVFYRLIFFSSGNILLLVV